MPAFLITFSSGATVRWGQLVTEHADEAAARAFGELVCAQLDNGAAVRSVRPIKGQRVNIAVPDGVNLRHSPRPPRRHSRRK